MCRGFALAFLLLLAACGSSTEEPEPVASERPVLAGTLGARIELQTSRELEEIARLEDARSLGEGRLLVLAREHDDARVRERAVEALGRFPWPAFGADVTGTLARALEDADLDVRLAAAFAMGLRGDPDSGGTLLAYRNDPEASLRARVVEAACKLPDPSLQGPLVLALRDADLAVRMEAAVGAARWDTKASGASEVDRALLDALSPYRITRESAPKSAVEAELVWRILWSLGRRKAELGRGPFLEYASSTVVLERLFAVRGLGQLPPDAAGVRAVLAAVTGPEAAKDWRVVYEATAALGRFAAAERARMDERTRMLLTGDAPLEALQAAAEHPSVHVRAGAMEAVASFGDERRALELLQRGRLDLSVGVRAAALRSSVRISGPQDALDVLRRGARDDDPILRAAAADAAGAARVPGAREVLLGLARDPSMLVSTRAVEQLGQHPSDAVRAELHALLGHADNGMRLAAVLALEAMPEPTDVPPLVAALSGSSGEGSAEVAFNALELLAKIGTDEARSTVAAAQADPRPYVRAVAKRLVKASGATPAAEEPPFVPDHEVPVAGKDYPLYRFNPTVEVSTSRGKMTFELFPAEAPVHVHNFLALAAAEHYDGLSFHRVVPDFVVQGGDTRGDGNGAKPWAGEALRAEFTPRKYTRGSLGMPRNEDPDSGGSQFFVTHVPTPHLDGRYTIFGELRTGGSVLDQLEVGDRILSVKLLE
jgi:cyclophilin family peptidyl-prolyl cis-trans isomerase/HEAT repeat protein